MIRRPPISEVICDACRVQVYPPATPPANAAEDTAHFGELKNCFGFGSPHDALGSAIPGRSLVQVCETCWAKACAAIGLHPALLRPTSEPSTQGD